MIKQIYVSIAGGIICIILGFSLAVAILYFSKTIQKIDNIYSKLEKPVSCELPYGVQDQIDQTYKNITSATCNIEK